MDDDDLAGLSEQERAALEEPTGGSDEETLRAIAGDDDGDDTPDAGDEADDGADDADDGADDDTPAATPAPTPAPTAAPVAEKPADTQEPLTYTVAAPEDAEDKIKALRTEKATAFKQLMDGEITAEQYSEAEDRILGEIGKIERAVTAATVAAEITTQNAQRAYIARVNALFTAAKAEGVDYKANATLHEDLDRTVKFLANDPANTDKPEQWFLDKAHSMVKAMHGIGGAPAPAPAPASAKAKTGGKAPDLSGIPPSVRNAPPAAESDDGGEFAHLSNLKGMALERALARMTPEQQQRYLET